MRCMLGLTEKDTEKIIAIGATNYPLERVLIDEIIASRNAFINNTTHPQEKAEEIFASLARIVNSDIGRKVLYHYLRHEAVTAYELAEVILVDESTISRLLHKLRRCGVGDKRGIVDKPYHKGTGPKPKVWVLRGADPEASIRAQIRYADLKQAENGYQQKRLMKAKENEAHAKELDDAATEGYAKRVITELGFLDLDQPKALQKINAGISTVNIPFEYQESVRNEVIEYFYKVKLDNPKIGEKNE